MALKTYSISKFIGINQNYDENSLSPYFSPDAANMNTDKGNLRVAFGYMKFIPVQIPGDSGIRLLSSYKSSNVETPVIITGNDVYIYKNSAWNLIHSFTSERTDITYDTEMVRINTTDYLLIADGEHQMIKYDGNEVTPFGSEEGCSNIPVSYLTMYRGRLFAAGDPDNPDRLYYSVLPGSGRTIEDWGTVEASPTVEGGHIEIGSTGGDPILAIRALSNQLLIFKRNSLYRLIGDRPSNFTIERIDTNFRKTIHTAIATYGDVLYFVTQNGLYYYNGVTARPCGDMLLIKDIMLNADVTATRAIVVCDKLYFTLRRNNADEMIEYDLIERKYMLRNGFPISDIASIVNVPMLVNNKRYVYLFDRGHSYDGEPIHAYWSTPTTDFGDKASIKRLNEIYLRGTGDTITITTRADNTENVYTRRLPQSDTEVLEIPLLNEGRCSKITFSNNAGGYFNLCGGVELSFGVRRRTE